MLKIDDRYLKYFDKGISFRYANFLRILGIEATIMISTDSNYLYNKDTSITVTLIKSSWKATRSAALVMLDTLDDDTLEYYADQMYLGMISEINRAILDEIKL